MQGVSNYNKIIYNNKYINIINSLLLIQNNIDNNFRKLYLRHFFFDFFFKLLILLSIWKQYCFNYYKNP